MTDEQPQPRSFRADLGAGHGEATITLGDLPTLAFSRPPYGFTRPLAREELGALAAGRFAADLDAQLRACAPPPLPPLDAADRARIVRLAGEAWIALTVCPATPEPEPPVPTPAPGQATGQAGLWPTPAATRVVAQSPDAGAAAISSDEDEVNAAPANTDEPDDGETPIAGATAASPSEVARLPVPAAPRRALRVTLTLTPEGADAFQALVGVGAEGCDPHYHAVNQPGALATILDVVSGVIAAAEGRWLDAPRYPGSGTAAAPAATARSAAPAKPGAKKPARRQPEPDPASATAPAAAAAPAAKRQIELFG